MTLPVHHKYLLSNEVTFKESGITNYDSDLQYDTDLELSVSSASDVTYLYDNSSFCNDFGGNSSENLSVQSDNTFIYNISPNELNVTVS